MLTDQDSTKLGVPPAFKDRYVVRVIEPKFGLSKADNPMITLQLEVVGVPVGNKIVPIVQRGNQSWQVAGLRTNAVYLTLKAGPALGRVLDFHEMIGLPRTVDETNPPIHEYNGKVLEAILTSEESVQRKALTPEDVVAGKKVGDPILDNDGKEIKSVRASLVQFLCLWRGEEPAGF